MPTVTYVEHDGTQHAVEVPVGLSVMEGATNNGVAGIDADCGGACACATCHVYVDPEWLEAVGPPNENEKDMLEFGIEVRPTSRLSCQIRMRPALAGLVVHVPETQR
jgi:2Fe-2S ferredoxin